MASETMEGNADQFREVWLRIETGRTGVEGIPIGIEFDFQFQIPMHPNSWHSRSPIPIPNSSSQCLLPKAA
jgi:hypothetical protein